MKRYIKPECEIIEVQMEGHLLEVSPNAYNDEVGDAEDGAWLAPKRPSATSIWGDEE